MKKLLGMLASIGLVSTAGSSVMAMVPITTTNKENVQVQPNELLISSEQKEYSRQQILDWVYGGTDVYTDTIDLDEISAALEETEINLFGIDFKDEKAVTQKILMDVIFNNYSWAQQLTQVMRDYLANELDWLIQLPQLPSLNTSTSGEVSALYLGESGQFVGVLKAKVKLTNSNTETKTELSTVLKNTDLGKITNLDSSSIKSSIIEINPELKETDFDIVRHYQYAVVTATEDSGYIGTVKVTYNYTVLSNGQLQTATARADAYNSEQSSSKSISMRIKAVLGKDEFLKTFNTLNFKFAGKSWNNGNKPDPNEMNRQHSISVASDTSRHLYTHNYDGAVNWMHSQGNLTLKWEGDDLVLNLSVEVRVYASAWNAYWARAEATGIMENINIQ